MDVDHREGEECEDRAKYTRNGNKARWAKKARKESVKLPDGNFIFI